MLKMKPLICPTSSYCADQCREMGLKVGDTIIGREDWGENGWSESKLTVLFIGEQAAVFKCVQRGNKNSEWGESRESGSWVLHARPWSLVEE